MKPFHISNMKYMQVDTTTNLNNHWILEPLCHTGYKFAIEWDLKVNKAKGYWIFWIVRDPLARKRILKALEQY